jgi:hypothetical protein
MSLKSERAEAEVVGHMIILAITITGIAMISLVGIPSIQRMEDMVIMRNSEQTYSVFDSRASKVALGESPVQIISVDTGGGAMAVVSNSSYVAGHTSADDSYVLFELMNDTATNISIMIPMGKIVYMMGDREVAYEGGGLWSKYPEGSVMLSPPEFNYNGITLTFPVINISGNSSIGGKGGSSLKIEKIGTAQMIYPNGSYQNPIPVNITQINITIKSEYYDAWADYFKSLRLVKVSENQSGKKVIVTLVAPPLATNFSYGALASTEIDMENNAKTDSYNSSKGPYSASKSGNGSIRAASLIQIKNGAVVNGSALSGADITGGGTIMKDAYARSFGGVTVLGTKYPQVDGLELASTTNLVQSKIRDYKINNNNNGSSAGGCLSGAGNATLDDSGSFWPGGKCTISAGNYYLSKFDLPNNDILTFNTGAGAVNIALAANMHLSPNVNLTVSGGNPVRIYLDNEIGIDNNVKINPTTNQSSVLFQVISSDSQVILLSNNVGFSGFIWAPGAEIDLQNNNGVYGAIVGRKFDISNNQEMHYDEALQNINTEIGTGTSLMYMYISRNNVTASLS